MSDVNELLIQPLQKFSKDSMHLIKKCTKPDRKEDRRSSNSQKCCWQRRHTVGILVRARVGLLRDGTWSLMQEAV
ncbi:unnamed protein product [Pylaiella littoralis]